MAENLVLSCGSDAVLRGEQVNIRHVLRVPRQRDLFGCVIATSFRATCVYPDGRFTEADVRELQPIDA